MLLGLRDIKALRVRCVNGDSCDWEGSVATWEEHLKKCGSVLVTCPLNCRHNGEAVVLLRKDMEEHLTEDCLNRIVKCEHCGREDKLVTIMEVHSRQCSKKKVPCPNLGCCKSVEQGKMDDHVQNECEYTVVPCRYSAIGCTKKNTRTLMAAHEADGGAHFPLSLSKIVRLDDEVAFLQQEVSQLRRLVAEAVANSEAASEASSLLKTENVTLNDEMVVLRGEASSMRRDMGILQNEAALLKSEVDALNKKATAFVTLPGFGAKRAANEEFVSESFFTVPNGYKMCLVVHPNGSGDGEGTYVSVYVEVLEVTYKERLKWPLMARVKVELLNQLADKANQADKNHKTYITSISAGLNGGWLCPQFISHSDLIYCPTPSTRYLLDDALYFRVTVQESF